MKANTTPARGWGPVGRRVVEPVPRGRWKTITSLAGLRSTGLVAPLVVDGAMNGELSLAYVRRHLTAAPRPGGLVAVDNRPSHKVAGAAEAIRGAGAGVVYLPPYSPGPNPIGQVFAKAKAETRQRKPRTVAATEQLCGDAVDWSPADECRRSIRHAGYGPQGSG